VATTSLLRDRPERTALVAQMPLRPAGLHLMPIEALSSGLPRQTNSRVGPRLTVSSLQYPVVAGDSRLIHHSSAVDPLVLDTRPLLLATVDSSSSSAQLQQFPGLLYPSFMPPVTAAAVSSVFSLAGLQPVMSISSEAGRSSSTAAVNRRENNGDEDHTPAYILPDLLSESSPHAHLGPAAPGMLGTGGHFSRTATTTASSYSSSNSSSSSRESSPKSSDSPATTARGTAVGGRIRCQHCGRICSTLAHLNNHVRSVHSLERLNGPKTLQCGQCPKMFGRRSHLMEHLRTVHEGRKRIYQRARCKECGKEFARQCSLNQHLSTSHGK
jgi:hypothetical protein